MTTNPENENQNEKDSNRDFYYIAVYDENGQVQVVNIGSDLSSKQIETMSDSDIIKTYTLYRSVMERLYNEMGKRINEYES